MFFNIDYVLIEEIWVVVEFVDEKILYYLCVIWIDNGFCVDNRGNDIVLFNVVNEVNGYIGFVCKFYICDILLV